MSDPNDICDGCAPLFRLYMAKINMLTSRVKALEKECNELEKKSVYWEKIKLDQFNDTEFDYNNAESEYTHPDQLKIAEFGKYVDDLTNTHPILTLVLNLFTSNSHKRKYNSNNVHPKWKLWSDFYRAFICDLFLKTRKPKIIRRTQLLLSVHFLLSNMPDSCWKLLQRLKVVVSKEVVEKWVGLYEKSIKFENSILVLVFDNCDFKKRVTHVRNDFRTTMLHIITQLVLEIPVVVDVPSRDIWCDVDRQDFGMWIQSTSDDALHFANKCWGDILKSYKSLPLKFECENQFGGDFESFQVDI